MLLFHALILGIVQGLGEFLPISSSAHLIIVPWLFGWAPHSLGFDVALHWGTLLAVLVYFRNDVWLLMRGFWHSLFKSTRNFNQNIYQKLSWYLILASIPGAIIGKLLEEKAETIFRNPVQAAVTLGIFGLIVLFVDMMGKKEKNLDKITWKNALVIGLSQALAIFPGVSRSGATMAAALSMGFKRADAARFSFLMSIPIILGAGLLKIKDFNNGVTSVELIVGVVASAVFGFLSIKFLLQYLAKHDFKVFVGYRLLVMFVVIALYVLNIR